MRSLMILLAFCAGGCGARTGLADRDAAVPVADAGAPDAPLLADAGTDAGSDSSRAELDAGVDAGPSDADTCDEPLLVIEQQDRDFCPGHYPNRDSLLLGENGRTIMFLDIRNRSSRTMRVTRWNFSVYVGFDDDRALRSIRRLWLRDAATRISYGEGVPVRHDASNLDVPIRPADFLIPPGTMTVAVEIDLAAYVDGGSAGWDASFGFASWADVDVIWEDGSVIPSACVCSCLAGTPFYLSTGFLDVFRARFWIDSPLHAVIVEVGGERQVGEFRAGNEANAGNYAATLQAVTLGLSGISHREGHTLRLYVDTVDPAHLIGSTVIGAGFPTVVEFRDADLVDVAVPAGMFRNLYVTIDTDGFMSSQTLQVDVQAATWSDGVAITGDVACEPVEGYYVTFVRPPP